MAAIVWLQNNRKKDGDIMIINDGGEGYYRKAKERRESGENKREFEELLKRDWEEFGRRFGKKK